LYTLVDEIWDGRCNRINGLDICDLEWQTMRERIGMLPQDTWFFSGTICDNIKYGNENATEKQIQVAAKAAYDNDFIQTKAIVRL
jgi:ABC-type multidrug transport system fused ATPase/permease subunit